MSAVASTKVTKATKGQANYRMRVVIEIVLLVILLAAMAMSTKVVKIGYGADTQTQVFEPEAYGKKQFPKTQAAIEKRAVDAATLVAAIAKD